MTTIFLAHTPAMLANYYGERALAALQRLGDVRLNETGRVLDDPLALAAAAADARIIVADRQTPAPAAFFEAMPDLVAICRVAVDIRNIDVAAASRLGILVTQASPGFINSVAELTIGLMVDLGRGVSDAVVSYRAGVTPTVRPGRQLHGSTLGIIGYGAIGRRLAELGQALGMTVLVNDPHQPNVAPGLRLASLPDLLATADFVVCLAVATEATENLIGADAFARMRPDAFFVNMSRGNLVDEAALEAALSAGRIAGAAMDVGRAPDQMPTPRLAGRPDVVATPHIGGLTPQAAEHQAFDTVRQVADLVEGRVPQGAVNAEHAYRLHTR
jgi:D-3-phosphoglycerate dehydrogenase / 2-oxoglutarate reductase